MKTHASPPSYADLRLVVDYLRSVRNEIALDVHAFKMGGLNPDRYGKIPRPSRWIVKVRQFAFLSKLIQYICLPLWYFLGPTLFKRQSLVLGKRKSAARRVKFDPSGQILAFTSRTMDIVHPRHIYPLPKQWLELPWLPLANLPENSEIISAIDILDEFSVDRSLALAKLAHRALQFRRGMSGWGLQSYTAWRWFLTRLAVDKLPGPLLTVDHFDRWAILADGSVLHSRQRQPTRRLTVMQHGSVNADATPQGLGIRLPTRLRAVSHLHAYTAADVKVFKEEILSTRCAERGLSVTLYRPIITLADMALGTAPSILFVGHPLCEIAHCALMAALRQQGKWEIFYKIHPASRSSKHISKLPWIVIRGRSIFPRVDVIVSYPSTMVAEYAAHGIPAVVHQMDIPADKILSLLTEILQTTKVNSNTAASPSADSRIPILSDISQK